MNPDAVTSPLAWSQEEIAGVRLRRHVARAGAIPVGAVEYDGGNRMWIWSTPLAEDAWGWGASEEAAKQALEAWLRNWLANFRTFFDGEG